jgi:hypothetical protein
MNTGTDVEIHNDVLVIGTSFVSKRPGGYITIFERSNNKWEFKANFSAKQLLPDYQLPMYRVRSRNFISASDSVIAVAAWPATWRLRKKGKGKAVAVFAKNNGEWCFIDTIYDPDIPIYENVGDGFAADISVDKNMLMILDPNSENADASPSVIHLYSVENGKLKLKEEIKDTIVIDRYYRYTGAGGKILDNMMLTTTGSHGVYIDDKRVQVTGGGIHIYEYRENTWELIETIDNKSHPAFEDTLQLRFVGMQSGMICIQTLQHIYILENESGSWKIKYTLETPIVSYVGVDRVVFNGKFLAIAYINHEVRVYRLINDSLILTDTISLHDFNKKKDIYSVTLSISGDTLVIGLNNVNLSDEASDAIAYIPYLPFFFPKNRGSVVIVKLLPDGGYVIEDIIVRDYNWKGAVRFKSKL